MSWLFSRALVAEYSEHISSASIRYALSSEMSTVEWFSCNAKTTELFRHSRYGMTFARLPEAGGEELLTSYLADSRVRHLAPLLAAETLPSISGRKCGEWYPKFNRPMCSPRMLPPPQLDGLRKTLPRWATRPSCFPFLRQTWVLTTFGPGIGYLHTPTTKANYAASSMQKWPSARAFVEVFGRPDPIVHEWLMGWPEGWSDTKPLEMDRYRLWQRRLCGHLQMLKLENEEAA